MKFTIYYYSEILQQRIDKSYVPFMREICCDNLECLFSVSERISDSPRAGTTMADFNIFKGGFTGDFIEVGFAPYQLCIDFEDREIIVLDIGEI